MLVSPNLLWLLIALFAGATVADVLAPSLLLTIVQLILMVAFALLHGAQRYGARGIAAFAVIASDRMKLTTTSPLLARAGGVY